MPVGPPGGGGSSGGVSHGRGGCQQRQEWRACLAAATEESEGDQPPSTHPSAFRGGATRLGARWGARSWEVWGGSPRPSTFHSPRIWPLPQAPSSGPLASLHSLHTAQGPQAPGQWCLFAARFQGREDVLCSLLQPEIFPRTRGWFGLPFAPGRSKGPARVQRFEERWEGLQGSSAEKASLRNWGAGGGSTRVRGGPLAAVRALACGMMPSPGSQVGEGR